MHKILNIGSLNIDCVYSVDHFILPGETMSSLDRNVYQGGKGLNQSIALAKSGADVYHCGLIGTEDNGEILKQALVDAKVNVDFMHSVPGPSGHTIIQVDRSGQNCIILFGGSNHKFTKEIINQALDNFSAGDYVVLQNEINELSYIIEEAHARGLKIFFNVSPCNESCVQLPLNKCDTLVINEIEAETLSGVKADAPHDILKALRAKYPQCSFVLTLGTAGSYYLGKEEDQAIYQASFKVKAVDTTAAGDTFLGFLVGQLSQGQGIHKALELASKAAAISVTRKGAGTSIPSIDEVESITL